MPANDSPAYLVARFLKTNNYEETLIAFINEANLPPDAGSLPNKKALTLEGILEEKRAFDKSLKYTKQGIEDDDEGATGNGNTTWSSSPAPSEPQIVTSLPSDANLLHVSVQRAFTGGGTGGGEGDGEDGGTRTCLVASTADRQVGMLVADGAGEQGEVEDGGEGGDEGGRGLRLKYLGNLSPAPLDSPVLSCVFIDHERVVMTAMSGLVCLYNLRTLRGSEKRDHKKYVVKAAVYREASGEGEGEGASGVVWLATAGWDARILLYRITGHEMGEPVADIKLQTNPETLLFAKDPDTHRIFLILSRRDSSFIYYYHLANDNNDTAAAAATIAAAGSSGPTSATASSSSSGILTLAGSQNLAPHSNAWVAFSPAAMALSPTDPTLLAVATSSLPHMKVLIVRLLFPSPDSVNNVQPVYTSQAEQGRASLARQDREEAAIQIHVSTMAPQTPYSTPQVCWRPNGSGVFVNGDDGVIRGVEAKTGKIIALLKDGHEVGSKIRSIWAGYVGSERRQEWLVTGGFDRRTVVWRPSLAT